MKSERPTSVSVISWVYIVFGTVLLLTGALALSVLFMDRSFSLLQINDLFFQFLIAIAAVVSGIGGLQGKPMARKAMIVISWILLILSLSLFNEVVDIMDSHFRTAMMIINLLFYVVPIIIILLFLSKTHVKQYFLADEE